MTNKEYIICCDAILHFLIVSEKESLELKSFDVPSNINMRSTLDKFGFNMISFTEHLNDKFKIYNRLWNESPKEFFKDKSKGLEFYYKIINSFRNDKINLILNDTGIN